MKHHLDTVFAVALPLILLSSGLVANGQIKAAAVSGSGATMNVRDLTAHGGVLIPPGHAQFESAVSQALGNHRSDLATAVKNLSVVLQNNSRKTVIGYALRWTFKKLDGTVQTTGIAWIEPRGLFDGDKPKDARDLPGGTLIRPGHARLVSMFARLNADSSNNLGVSAPMQEYMAQFNDMVDNSSDVTVTLDGLLFEDGTFAGPNEHHLFENFVESFVAVQDFYRHVMSLSDGGTPEPEIISWIKSQKVDDLGSANAIDFDRGVAVNEFLNVMDRTGFASAMELVRSKLFARPPKFLKLDQ